MRPIAKDFFRGMGKSRSKFISVFFIVLLGAAFFSGLRCSQDDMLLSAERYYDASALMDIRVVGTAGLTDADVRDIGALSVTERAEGGYSLDVISDTEEKIVVKLISYSENINLPSVTEGKLPASEGECMLDAVYAERYGYRVGDTVSFVSGTDTELSAQVCRTIRSIEVDLIMFGRSISLLSFGLGILLTLAFSMLINLVMYRSIKKINMIESLKSVE